MKSFLHFAWILSGIALVATNISAEPSSPPQPTQSPTSATVAPKLLTIDFPGGSFEKLTSMIANADGPSFNVIGEKADMNAILPRFSVRNVDASDLANALNTLLVTQRGLALMSAGPSVYTLFKPNPAGKLTTFASYQLAPYLKEQSVDDITAAIREAWQLNPSHDEKDLQLKYHPPTTLLLVAGSNEAVGVAERVIHSLKPLAPKTAEAEAEEPLAPSPPVPKEP